MVESTSMIVEDYYMWAMQWMLSYAQVRLVKVENKHKIWISHIQQGN